MAHIARSTVGEEFLAVAVAEFERYKLMAEGALEQLDDGDFRYELDDESNSVHIIVKHMAGNMRSRWTDFLTTDGEKPGRHRDGEFVAEEGRAQIMEAWDAGWSRLFDTLAGLREADLLETVYIRNQPQSVLYAIARQLTHYAHHIGQIAYIGKHLKGCAWKSLSIPKGKSEDYMSR